MIIRYLSNVLTDNEKQKAFTLFLGEFQPDTHFPNKNLWDDDLDYRLQTHPGDVVAEKPNLYPLITRHQKLLQFNSKIYNPHKAFSDEGIKIIAEEEPTTPGRIDKKAEKGKQQKSKKEKPVEINVVNSQANLTSDPIDRREFLPSHYNYVERFRQLEAEVEKNFYSFLDS